MMYDVLICIIGEVSLGINGMHCMELVYARLII